MSVLKSLKLANAVPVRATNDPVQRTRDKVVTALAEQKAMAEAKIAGEHYAPTQTVWRKNEAGERVQVEKLKRLRPGWFIDAAGKTFFALRYAGKPIEFAKDKNAVDVGDLGSLPAVIDQLTAAVQAGELDAQLAAAANARGEQLRKAKA
jgi:hypothetical protein